MENAINFVLETLVASSVFYRNLGASEMESVPPTQNLGQHRIRNCQQVWLQLVEDICHVPMMPGPSGGSSGVINPPIVSLLLKLGPSFTEDD